MTRTATTAVAAVAGDVEALDVAWATGPTFEAPEVATIRAAVEDEGDCLVSVVSADLADVARAVQSVRALARECRAAVELGESGA